ncbi:AarF/ABC1/UbiB kinase family protein [Pseudoalteromonas sp. R3]|nr:AarF/ABC1/UbiB kinase family protein [Pseudoalteromonas sp. R3]
MSVSYVKRVISRHRSGNLNNKSRRVPSGRLSRLAHFGGLAGKVASNVMIAGAKQALSGQKASRSELLLQSGNIHAVAEKLSHLRGAAMKLGQLLSMDAGELLPAELSVLLERLRSDAAPMPHKQLVATLEKELGPDWLDKFSHIELNSFARASIGQVHKATSEQGLPLAIKVQYPGVADSIHSDVDNVVSLIKLSGLLPKTLNITSLVEEAKQQLLVETDYYQEAKALSAFEQALAHNPHFKVPKSYAALSSKHLLTMEFVQGEPLEAMTTLPQAKRDQLAYRLIALFFTELFELRMVQTDPNLANYQYNRDTDQIVLLDFGATRTISPSLCLGYKKLLQAGAEQNRQKLKEAACEIGYFSDDIDPHYQNAVLSLFELAISPLRASGPFDFASSGLAKQITEQGRALSTQSRQWHTPPVDALFIHRKLAGLYLIASRLKANVELSPLLNEIQV